MTQQMRQLEDWSVEEIEDSGTSGLVRPTEPAELDRDAFAIYSYYLSITDHLPSDLRRSTNLLRKLREYSDFATAAIDRYVNLKNSDAEQDEVVTSREEVRNIDWSRVIRERNAAVNEAKRIVVELNECYSLLSRDLELLGNMNLNAQISDLDSPEQAADSDGLEKSDVAVQNEMNSGEAKIIQIKSGESEFVKHSANNQSRSNYHSHRAQEEKQISTNTEERKNELKEPVLISRILRSRQNNSLERLGVDMTKLDRGSAAVRRSSRSGRAADSGNAQNVEGLDTLKHLGRERRTRSARIAHLGEPQRVDSNIDRRADLPIRSEGRLRPRLHGQSRPHLSLPAPTVKTQTPKRRKDESRYCICGDVFFGDMIACDDPNCPIEWYHLDCVQLKRLPAGEWYCPSCIARRRNLRKR
ncbi:uncharacterized protein V1516DRAFT_674207 [Lipomyces oligophaga]|uniref:uncharacterized protein n=1 Tax=Lipomyces oligophaga TaxID=45792 RepID=UPI0034CEE977